MLHYLIELLVRLVSSGQAMFSAQGDVTVTGGNNIVNHGYINMTSQDENEARELFAHTIVDAMHTSNTVSSQNMCLWGTRTLTLERLTNHLTSTDSADRDFLWFEGPAGGGKSAVMRTLANRTPGAAIASYFFYRADDRRNTIEGFIPTLAYQMSRTIPSTRPFITAAIREDPAVLGQCAKRQARVLLGQPLIKATRAPGHMSEFVRLVILVDGLDECADVERQVEIIDVLSGLVKKVRKHTRLRIKVIIASRPESDIRTRVDSLDEEGISTIFSLDPKDAELALFYDTEFAKMRAKHHLPESWPSPEQKKQLLEKTSGQYAFATTAIKYTASGDPEYNLELVLEAIVEPDTNPLDALDQLYAFVLSRIPKSMRPRALDALGCNLIKDGLERGDSIATFLGLPDNFIHRLALYLSSLFQFPEDGAGKISPYHATLADFLFNESRSGKFGLFISQGRVEDLLATSFVSLLAPRARTERDWKVLSSVFSSRIAGVSIEHGPYGGVLTSHFLEVDTARLDLWAIALLRQYHGHIVDDGEDTTMTPECPPIIPVLEKRTLMSLSESLLDSFALWYLYMRVFRKVGNNDEPCAKSLGTHAKEVMRHTVSGVSWSDAIGRGRWDLQDVESWFKTFEFWPHTFEYLWFNPAYHFREDWQASPAAWVRRGIQCILQRGWTSDVIPALASFHQEVCGPTSVTEQARCEHCLVEADRFRVASLTIVLRDWLDFDDGPLQHNVNFDLIFDICRFAVDNSESVAQDDWEFLDALSRRLSLGTPSDTKPWDVLLSTRVNEFAENARKKRPPQQGTQKVQVPTTPLSSPTQTTTLDPKPKGQGSDNFSPTPFEPQPSANPSTQQDVTFPPYLFQRIPSSAAFQNLQPLPGSSHSLFGAFDNAPLLPLSLNPATELGTPFTAPLQTLLPNTNAPGLTDPFHFLPFVPSPARIGPLGTAQRGLFSGDSFLGSLPFGGSARRGLEEAMEGVEGPPGGGMAIEAPSRNLFLGPSPSLPSRSAREAHRLSPYPAPSDRPLHSRLLDTEVSRGGPPFSGSNRRTDPLPDTSPRLPDGEHQQQLRPAVLGINVARDLDSSADGVQPPGRTIFPSQAADFGLHTSASPGMFLQSPFPPLTQRAPDLAPEHPFGAVRPVVPPFLLPPSHLRRTLSAARGRVPPPNGLGDALSVSNPGLNVSQLTLATPTSVTSRTPASGQRRKQDASFACPVPNCGATFTRHFNLKGHIRSHNEEKPFKCHWPGCGKGFARQHDCKRHEQLHTNYRPFVCDGCAKPFARMDALNRHLRSEGGALCAKIVGLRGLCKICGVDFLTEEALRAHQGGEAGTKWEKETDQAQVVVQPDESVDTIAVDFQL